VLTVALAFVTPAAAWSQEPLPVGRLEIPAQGIGGDMEVFAAPPNKLRSNIELPGLGSIKVGFDGDVAWSINPAVGPMVLDGMMLNQMRQQADWNAALHPETYIASMETVEKTDFDGHTCYKVKIVTIWDEEYFEFFDVDSGLLVGNERTQASPMGDVPATTLISDYRQVGDLLIAMKTVQRVMGMEQIITITVVEAVEIEDSVFALPPEIEALVEEKVQQEGNAL
jgi:hypothetical protein